jgi:hypothetical protein
VTRGKRCRDDSRYHFCSVSNQKEITMTNKIEAARRALRSVGLHEATPFHAPLMAALAEHGLIPSDGDGGELRASAAKLTRIQSVQAKAKIDSVVAAALKFAGGQLSQCGSSLDEILNDAGDDVSLTKLNAAIAKKSPEWRINCRTALARAGLID